jgi:hypothetical protein
MAVFCRDPSGGFRRFLRQDAALWVSNGDGVGPHNNAEGDEHNCAVGFDGIGSSLQRLFLTAAKRTRDFGFPAVDIPTVLTRPFEIQDAALWVGTGDGVGLHNNAVSPPA